MGIFFAILFTLLSGWCDSQGFIYASKSWHNDHFLLGQAIRSLVTFNLGIISYVIAVRFLDQSGIITPEIQFVGWFVVALVGVAFSSGAFFKWQALDQIVGVGVIVALGWLIVHMKG